MDGADLLRPRKLKPGDRVAAVSLSWGGPGALPHRYEAGKRQLQEEFGLEVVETPHARAEPGWLDRNPRARADDLMGAFADPSIRGIISTIGGEHSIRLLPYLRPEVIRSNPKVFLGYLDAAVTHLVCFRAGLVSFFGPAIMTGFAENGGMFPYLVASLRKTLFSSEPVGEVRPNTDGWTAEYLDWAVPENQSRRRRLSSCAGWRFLQGRGRVQGRLIGGCLEVLEFLRGTSAWPDPACFEDAILFLETSEEGAPPAVLREALRVYAAMGLLGKLSGILFGRPGGKIPVEEFSKYDEAILKVVSGEEGLTELPVVTHMDFGHTDPMFVLPYGVAAEIDCDAKRFVILEAAVVD